MSQISRVLFAGGGTGGHLFMALALAEELRARNSDFDGLFVGTPRELENRIVSASGYRLVPLRIGGLKKVGVRRALGTLLRLPGAFLQAFRIVRRFAPAIVVGVGGYSSGPVVLAARLSRIPSLLIEPNVYPGLTNRLLAPWADGIVVAFETTAGRFGSKARLTGIPVRAGFYQARTQVPERGPLRVLICGGSQGSRSVNRLWCEALDFLEVGRFWLVHQTGREDVNWVRDWYRQRGWDSEVTDFIHDMPEYFRKSDLVVSRAGASTLAEIAAAAKASVLLPFPHAADDHQRKNAEEMAVRGAAVVLDELRTSGQRLAETLLQLEGNRQKVRQMSEAAGALARPDSTKRIVEVMERLVA